MKAYYNENDPYCAQWLRNLIDAGHIAYGDVDERDIQEVQARDLADYTQCHFFAGIGGWSLALRLAGWPDDKPVYTGSCPCQPYSNAGKRLADNDPRNLWPEFRRLLVDTKPATVFGEQVASKAGRLWLAGVRTDLEAMGYAVGAADLCAAGVSAPHIRQRLWWVADASHGNGWGGECGAQTGIREDKIGRRGFASRSDDSRFPDAQGERSGETREHIEQPAQWAPWSGATWVQCADGKARRIEPSIEPLAYGVSNRVGRLRATGNAIVPQVAAEFIASYMDIENFGDLLS